MTARSCSSVNWTVRGAVVVGATVLLAGGGSAVESLGVYSYADERQPPGSSQLPPASTSSFFRTCKQVVYMSHCFEVMSVGHCDSACATPANPNQAPLIAKETTAATTPTRCLTVISPS